MTAPATNARVTDLDRHIARRLKEYREQNAQINMAQLSKFLGITYQSYQAMEKGEVSFRVSTLERLATFYNTDIQALIGSDKPQSLPNIERISYVVNLMRGLPSEFAGDVVRFTLGKHLEAKLNGA
jgi:transcriptional regulator with XRE-family HTH domain